MFSGRFTSAIADRKSGGERSWTVSLWTVNAVIGVVVGVPALIALGTGAWVANSGVTKRAPEIESANANDRPSAGAVPRQIASEQSTNPEPRGRLAESSEPVRLDSDAATRGGSGGSIPSPPRMPAPEPGSSTPRSGLQARVSEPSTFAPGAAAEAPAPAAAAEALPPSSAPGRVAPATAPETPAPAPALEPRSPPATPRQLARDHGASQPTTPQQMARYLRREAWQQRPRPLEGAPPAAVAPVPAPSAAVPPVPPPSPDNERRPDGEAAGRTALTVPPAAPVQQPRAPVPAPESTAGVARVSPRPDDNRLPDAAPPKRAAEPATPARPPQPQTRAPAREQASSAVVAPRPRRQGNDDGPPDREAAARDAFKEAFVRVGQTRSLAEGADAPKLASGSFQAAVALQGEAQELSKSGRLVDAAGRLVEANGMFRLAEAEARLKAVARDRSPVAGGSTPALRSPEEPSEGPASAPVTSAPTPAPRSPAEPRAAPAPSPVASAPTPVPRSPAEPREAPAPAGSSRVESRPLAPAPAPRATNDVQDAVK